MKLHHLALTLKNKEEVRLFYEQVLGFSLIRKFELNAKLASQIFDSNKNVQVFQMEGHGMTLELFIDERTKQNNYNHWCLSFSNREEFIKKAQAQKAKVIRIPRETHDLIFVKDQSGNIFEIKEEYNTTNG